MASIERSDGADVESFRERDHRSVDRSEWKLVIAAYELRDSQPVGGGRPLDKQVSRGEISQEAHLGLPAKPFFEQAGHFRDDQLRDQQRTGMRFEKVQARLVIAVIFIDVGIQRAGIDDQRDLRVSCRMISSMRRAVS